MTPNRSDSLVPDPRLGGSSCGSDSRSSSIVVFDSADVPDEEATTHAQNGPRGS